MAEKEMEYKVELFNKYFKIVTSNENYQAITLELRAEDVPFEPDNGSELLPLTTVEVDDDALDLNKDPSTELHSTNSDLLPEGYPNQSHQSELHSHKELLRQFV